MLVVVKGIDYRVVKTTRGVSNFRLCWPVCNRVFQGRVVKMKMQIYRAWLGTIKIASAGVRALRIVYLTPNSVLLIIFRVVFDVCV